MTGRRAGKGRGAELAAIIRFLAPLTQKWMGCGFLVPGPPGDANLHVMTCAHVVADLLDPTGVEGIARQVSAPDGEVTVQFNGVHEHARRPVRGRVVPGAWRPVERSPDATDAAIDIAVIRLDLVDLPPGAGLPAFAVEVPLDTDVMAHGPYSPTDLTATAEGFWTYGRIRASARPDQINLLTADEVPEEGVVGGYSGGPLMTRPGLEIAGMIRSVIDARGRNAFALPLETLMAVWPHLAHGLRDTRVEAGLEALVDLIDREDQVLALSMKLRPMLVTEAGAPGLVFSVAGDRKQDHDRFCRRLRRELGAPWLRGPGRETPVVGTAIDLSRGMTTEQSLAMMLEELRGKLNAPDVSTPALARAMAEQDAPWLVQLRLRKGEDRSDLLLAFLDRWSEIAARARCECYLGLTFGYDPRLHPDDAVAGVLRDVAGHACAPFAVPPLRSVVWEDLADWPEAILKHGHLEDERVAERLAQDVQALFEDADEMTMWDLSRAIDRSGLSLG